MLASWLLAWLACCVSAQGSIEGTVLDAETGRPVPFAHVVLDTVRVGTACSEDGRFALVGPAGPHYVRAFSMGYAATAERVYVCVDSLSRVTLRLRPVDIRLTDEVVIYGRRPDQDGSLYVHRLNSLDEVAGTLIGADLVNRAHFPSELSLRGMGGGQVATVIDGMKIVPACIDHMDPVSAYVEIENLERLEITRGAFDQSRSQSLGGTVNLVTAPPKFESGFQAETEAGFEGVSNLVRGRTILNFSRGPWALRGSYSYKNSGDYAAGGGRTVHGSGYEKMNYKLDAARRFGPERLLTVSIIGDNAWDIGYPTMLMDARKTDSQVWSLTYEQKFSGRSLHRLSSRVYYSWIAHWMDDYDRDVTSREVMANMYMPMFGETHTFGVIEEAVCSFARQTVRLTAEYYYLSAFADMTMSSVEPGVSPMYTVNLGDAAVHNLSLSVDYRRRLSSAFQWGLNGRMDWSDRSLKDRDGRRLLQAASGVSTVGRQYVTGALASTLGVEVGERERVIVSAAVGQRMPTHLENYGHFLYQVLDGYFYTGNPDLKPETSYQSDVAFERTGADLDIRTSVYYSIVHDFIGGRLQTSEFKTFVNYGSAHWWGVEGSVRWRWSPSLMASGGIQYIRAVNRSLDEPLPMIAPLKGRLAVSAEGGRWWAETEMRWAARQHRIASRSTLEDETPAYAVFNIRVTRRLGDRWSCKMGVENVLDRRYHDHLSVGNLAEPGRNVYVTLNVRY
jgi:iron complex outermembrane receptor protein